jgi:hypothetical protein
MTLKGQDLTDRLQQFGTVTPAQSTGFSVQKNGQQIAYYDLTEDKAFRFGWVQHRDGNGRTDCLSWVEFLAHLEAHSEPTHE